MKGQRALILTVFGMLLVLGLGRAWAEQEGESDEGSLPAEESGGIGAQGDAEGGESPATSPEGAAEGAEGAEETPQSDEGEGEAGDEELPLAPANRVKLRPPPGRAISAQEIQGRTRQLSKLMETSETRLRELAERVLSGKIGRAGSTVVFRNEMGSSFKLVRAVFALDGAPIFTRTDESGELGSRNEIELFNGSIVPGEHRLSVNLEFRGHGYGIFSYLKGYRFKVRSSYAFRVAEGKHAQVRVVGYEKGDQNTPLEERPDIRYVERVETLTGSPVSSD